MAKDITTTSTHTPFTNQEISQVNSSSWRAMTTAQLEDERIKLNRRLSMAYSLGNPAIISGIERGLQALVEIIAIRSGETSGDRQ